MKTTTLQAIAKETVKTPTAILGNPQIGKTTLAKHLVHSVLTLCKDTKVRVWDSSTKWVFNAPCQAYLTIDPQKHSSENCRELLKYKSIIFDTSEIHDVNFERDFQKGLIFFDVVNLIWRTKANHGAIRERVLEVVEESQGIFETNALRRNEHLWLAKAISVGANYGLSWLIITRRASEVSTKIFEHSTTKIIGNSNQPNCIRKLKSILNWETVERIKTLGIGEFMVLTPNGVFNLKTEKYNGSNPKQLKLEQRTKRSGFLGLKTESYNSWVEESEHKDNPNEDPKVRYCQNCGSELEEDEHRLCYLCKDLELDDELIEEGYLEEF